MAVATIIVLWLVALVCFAAGVANFLGSEPVRAEFARFGYPPYWHKVTGVLECVGAVLFVIPATRWVGLALLGAVLLAALGTVILHRDIKSIAPCVLLLAGLAFIGLRM